VAEDLSGALSGGCPGYFKEDDRTFYAAAGLLQRAEASPAAAERKHLTREALRLMLKARARLPSLSPRAAARLCLVIASVACTRALLHAQCPRYMREALRLMLKAHARMPSVLPGRHMIIATIACMQASVPSCSRLACTRMHVSAPSPPRQPPLIRA
jgi:hypothetical protein